MCCLFDKIEKFFVELRLFNNMIKALKKDVND